MGRIAGSASVDIGAPLAVVYAVAADIERMPDWQTGLHSAAVLERGRDGQARRVHIQTSHGAAILRFDYREPFTVAWQQETGDAAHFAGMWRFEAAAAGRTRATYEIEVDLGGAWGLLIAGPLKARLRERFVDAMPLRLREHVERVSVTYPTAR